MPGRHTFSRLSDVPTCGGTTLCLSVTCGWIFGWFPPFGCCEWCCCERMCTSFSLNTYFQLFWVYISRSRLSRPQMFNAQKGRAPITQCLLAAHSGSSQQPPQGRSKEDPALDMETPCGGWAPAAASSSGQVTEVLRNPCVWPRPHSTPCSYMTDL